MPKSTSLAVLACMIIFQAAPLLAKNDRVQYVPYYRDPANEELRLKLDSLKDVRDSITDEIRDRQEEFKKQEREKRQSLQFDFTGVVKPASPDDFKSEFHFPPVRQYRTGTCWCFSGTSFLESEVYRLTGKKIQLSVMYTVYHEYLEKARYFVRQRGLEWNGEGSETNAVTRMVKKYGAVPLDVYPGYVSDPRHDHSELSDEIDAFFEFVKANDFWDEDAVVEHVKLILNKYLGTPPETFVFEGKTITPLAFLHDVLKFNPDDYYSVMSTLSEPFYTQGPLEVRDNWWHDSSYCNVPLDEWFAAIVMAIDNGYTVTIGGDNSEPGWNGFEDACIIPDFDIPQSYINQDSREYRLYYGITGDDHGIHLVGHTRIDGRDWFLIKDSGSSGHWGKYKGYYFMRDDYVRLKMMTFTAHKDILADLLAKMKPLPGEE
jgi:bleomycin hydrolase